MKSTKFLLFLFLLIVHSDIYAQLKSAIVGIDGLTCSACSFATEKSIRKLDFVDSVKMELEKNIAIVYFKKESKISLQDLAQKVVDAGFSVRSIYTLVEINHVKVSNDFCFLVGNDYLHFIKIANETELNGLVTLKIVGEKFMSKKEFKNWKLLCSSTCANPSATDVVFSKTYYATLP